jgi:predicted dehydrogenase
MAETIGVGMIGYAFMGAAHSHAWRTAPHVFDLPLRPAMVALCGRSSSQVEAAAVRYGWESAETDWRELIKRDDVQLVDICTPGDLHAEIAIAALESGKHVLCEKPLANTLAEASAMAEAASRAAARGIRAMVGFNYRRVPALALARELVAPAPATAPAPASAPASASAPVSPPVPASATAPTSGQIGNIRHVRATYLQDWLVDPAFPLTWRLRREHAGSGALGDLGAHIVDLAQFLTGDLITGVSAATATFVDSRPLPSGSGSGRVTVDDAALFLARLERGALASFEATRFATGRKNQLQVELNGDRGSLVFNLETPNELWFYSRDDGFAQAGFRRILVTEPDHPYLSAWWPPGHVLGWDATFVHEVRDLVHAIADGADPAPSFQDGLRVQRVLAAVEESATHDSGWVAVSSSGGDRPPRTPGERS